MKRCKQEGYQLGVESSVATCYVAFMLAMDEVLHADREAILDVLKNADEKIVFTMDTYDRIDEVFDRFGVKLEFRAGLERLQEK